MTDLERDLFRAEADFPVPRRVRFYPVAGWSNHEETVIRSKPWALGHGAIVIQVEGRAGGVCVSHLEVI